MFLCRREGNGVFRSGVKVTIYLLFGLCFCSQFTIYRARVCSWQILVFSSLGILLACVAFRNDTYEKKWKGSCLLCGSMCGLLCRPCLHFVRPRLKFCS